VFVLSWLLGEDFVSTIQVLAEFKDLLDNETGNMTFTCKRKKMDLL